MLRGEIGLCVYHFVFLLATVVRLGDSPHGRFAECDDDIIDNIQDQSPQCQVDSE